MFDFLSFLAPVWDVIREIVKPLWSVIAPELWTILGTVLAAILGYVKAREALARSRAQPSLDGARELVRTLIAVPEIQELVLGCIDLAEKPLEKYTKAELIRLADMVNGLLERYLPDDVPRAPAGGIDGT